MRIRTASDQALLVEASDLNEAMRLHRALADVPGIVECVPGARTVLVRFAPSIVTAQALADTIKHLALPGADAAATGEAVIPVHYDGADLAEAASLLGVSTSELIGRHTAAAWRVGFSGFAPGFGYIIGDDPLFDVPRRASPRTRVPAGSVALAGAFTGVYPRESPGGWQLIGTTDAVLWDADREPPALLAPGVRVRFEAARGALAGAFSRASAGSSSAGGALSSGCAAIEIVRAPLQLLVQDRGRFGRAALGIPASGAADRVALADANRAVGNDPGAAGLEAIGAGAYRFRGAGVAVVTGAIGELLLTGDDDRERPVVHGVPFATADGDLLEVGHPQRGLRYLIGVRGGVAAPSVLGSRATDTLSGLGPAPVQTGDVLPIGTAARHAAEPFFVGRELPAPGELVVLTVTLGAHDDWFTDTGLRTLREQEWEVTVRSDRIGIRLHGATPLERAVPGELPSEAVVTGAIQVPADGQPVVFLADHPTTGGYPVIAALTADALDLAAQLPPGVRVRFRVRAPAA